MSSELLDILNTFKKVCDDWNLREIKSEQELIDKLRVLNKRLELNLNQLSIFPESEKK